VDDWREASEDYCATKREIICKAPAVRRRASRMGSWSPRPQKRTWASGTRVRVLYPSIRVGISGASMVCFPAATTLFLEFILTDHLEMRIFRDESFTALVCRITTSARPQNTMEYLPSVP